MNKSAGFSVPRTFLNCTTSDSANSWTHRCPILTWRNLPLPFRLTTANAAEESTCTLTTKLRSQPKANCDKPMASLVALTSAISSASPELNVTHFCVVLQVRRQWLPRMIAPPEVDRAVLRQPAQSLSLHATRFMIGFCNSKFHTTRGLCTK